MFNNKGVTKFTDAPHSVDHSFDVDVKVSCEKGGIGTAKELLTAKAVSVSGGTFNHRIVAGDLAVFEVSAANCRN